MNTTISELRLLKAMGRDNYLAMSLGYPSEFPSWNAYVKAKRSCLGEIPAVCFGLCPETAQDLIDKADLSDLKIVITSSSNYPLFSCSSEDLENRILSYRSSGQSEIQAFHVFASRPDEELILIGTLINFNGTLIES